MNRCIRFASVSFLLLVVDSSNGFIPNIVSRCRRGSNLLLFSTNEGQQTPVQKKQEQIMEMASLNGAEVSVYLIFANVIYILKYTTYIMMSYRMYNYR